MNKNIFFVIGYKGSGKDTVVGEALSRVFQTKRLSCSDGIRPSLAETWAHLIEANRVNEVQCTKDEYFGQVQLECRDWLTSKLLAFIETLPKDPVKGDKDHHCSRAYLIAHGNYNAWNNSTFWINKALANGAGVVAGVRRYSEVLKARGYIKNLKIVWVDRIGYKPVGSDNLDLTEEDADIVIRVPESSSLEDLIQSVEKLILDNRVDFECGKDAGKEFNALTGRKAIL